MYIYVHIYNIYMCFCLIFAHNTLAKVSARCHLSNNCYPLHSPPTAVPVTVAAAAAAAAAVPPGLAVGPAPTNVLWWTR